MGLVIVAAVVLFMPQGLADCRDASSARVNSRRTKTIGEAMLVADRLTRHFGGLTANLEVCITLERGKSACGPAPTVRASRPASTCSPGDLPPSRAHPARRAGCDRLDSAARSHRGIGRSYQRTNIFHRNSPCWRTARLAAPDRAGRGRRIFTDAMKTRMTSSARRRRSSRRAGLGASRLARPPALARRATPTEIAMVLATDARLLLIRRAAFGMGPEESAQMVELLRKLKQNRAILLVEHDMDACFAVADTITVMVEGSVLESGPPGRSVTARDVQAAYLGRMNMAEMLLEAPTSIPTTARATSCTG